MTFEFQLNEDDFVDAQLAHLRRGLRRTNKAVAILFGVIVVLAIITCVSWFIQPHRSDKQLWPYVTICASGLSAGVLWALYLWSGIPFRRQFRKIKALRAPMKIVVDNDEVAYQGAMGESKILWTAFEDWQESKKNFLLYTQPRLFFILPKRALQSEDVSAFRELAKSRIT